MTDSGSSTPELQAAEALTFARDHLGPASERLLADPAVQTLVQSSRRSGLALEDAVLLEVHRQASGNRSLSNEFLAYFLVDLLQIGHRLLSPGLRRFLDTGDLAQSVLGNVWEKLFDLRFENRARFLGLLSTMLKHKAIDQDRRQRRQRRREDLVNKGDGTETDRVPTVDPSPSEEAQTTEMREQLALALLRLPERDQRILKAHLQGQGVSAIAKDLNLTHPSARMALQRAIAKARREVARDEER